LSLHKGSFTSELSFISHCPITLTTPKCSSF